MRKNIYKIWKEKKQEEFNLIPIRWAFSEKQFDEVLKEWGLTREETDKLCNIDCGGIMKKSDYYLYENYWKSYDLEEQKKNKKFFVDMLLYELDNHEFGYTRELDDTFSACGITEKDLENEEIVSWVNSALEIWRYLNQTDEYCD